MSFWDMLNPFKGRKGRRHKDEEDEEEEDKEAPKSSNAWLRLPLNLGEMSFCLIGIFIFYLGPQLVLNALGLKVEEYLARRWVYYPTIFVSLVLTEALETAVSLRLRPLPLILKLLLLGFLAGLPVFADPVTYVWILLIASAGAVQAIEAIISFFQAWADSRELAKLRESGGAAISTEANNLLEAVQTFCEEAGDKADDIDNRRTKKWLNDAVKDLEDLADELEEAMESEEEEEED